MMILERPWTWWQGVGAIAAVIALVLTFWAIEKPSGNINAADVKSVLSVKTSWPVAPGCDGATSVAVFRDGPSPATVRVSPQADVRAALSDKGAAFGAGYLSLTFTVTGNAVAQIMSIRPLFYLRSNRQPAWIFEPEGGCGATYGRFFSLDLDTRTMVDLGVQGPPAAKPPGSPAPPTSPLGKSFHVSHSDPATVTIYARACKAHYYQWGLQITYETGTRTHFKYIGTQSDPFRSMGPLTRAVPAYTIAPPTFTRVMRAGTVGEITSCPA